MPGVWQEVAESLDEERDEDEGGQRAWAEERALPQLFLGGAGELRPGDEAWLVQGLGRHSALLPLDVEGQGQGR